MRVLCFVVAHFISVLAQRALYLVSSKYGNRIPDWHLHIAANRVIKHSDARADDFSANVANLIEGFVTARSTQITIFLSYRNSLAATLDRCLASPFGPGCWQS